MDFLKFRSVSALGFGSCAIDVLRPARIPRRLTALPIIERYENFRVRSVRYALAVPRALVDVDDTRQNSQRVRKCVVIVGVVEKPYPHAVMEIAGGNVR